jgi:ribosomal 50S subunit-associated protein YjgA (DUF615 family)
MGRVLGLKGCKRIGNELVKMDSRLMKLRKNDLSKMSLDDLSEDISEYFSARAK